MSWFSSRSDDNDHDVSLPFNCNHKTVDDWEAVEDSETGKVIYYNGVCECGIFVRTRKA